MTARSTWKSFERRVAKWFGSLRNPGSGSWGRSDRSRSDSVHDDLFIECKLREKHSVVTLWDQTKKFADIERKIPVVVLAEKNRPGFWLVVHSTHLTQVADYRNQAHAAETDLENQDCQLHSDPP